MSESCISLRSVNSMKNKEVHSILEKISSGEIEKNEREIAELLARAAIDILRRLRTKILSEGNSERSTELLEACEKLAMKLSRDIVQFILEQESDENFLERYVSRAKDVMDKFDLNELSLTTLFSDSQTDRQLQKHFEWIYKAIKNPDGYELNLGWKVLSKNTNGLRVEPIDLAKEDVLVVAPLSTGLFVVNLWNEALLALGKTVSPFNIETVALSQNLDQVISHNVRSGIKKVVILDDTVMNPISGTVGKTHDQYAAMYATSDTQVLSKRNS